MVNSKSIGDKIAEARKKLNISQAEIGKMVSISPQAVGKWERGESMPDFSTLNRLAKIFNVDLNYFSEDFESKKEVYEHSEEIIKPFQLEKQNWNWDMSRGNWTDSDFSGLNNLADKFGSSNIKNCKFINSNLSDLILDKNNIELCEFSGSNFRNSQLNSSNILKSQFDNCSFIDTKLYRNNIEKCDFTKGNFSGTELIEVNFENSIIEEATWHFTMFKKSNISHITFEGLLENCHFENCSFYKVKFNNVTITNSFFKYNARFKKVEFNNCKVDKLTYAFLKNNKANLSGIVIID